MRHLLAANGRVRAVTFALLLSLAVTAVALGGAARGTSASRSLIAIHEQGKQINDQRIRGNHGKFRMTLAEAPFGPGGTSAVYPDPSGTKYVNGQVRTLFTGVDTLTSKTGRLELRFAGTHIDLNGSLTPAGQLVGPAAEYGTWRIETATGIYRGWKGGGNWAAVISGYGKVQPYSVEWDGYVTR